MRQLDMRSQDGAIESSQILRALNRIPGREFQVSASMMASLPPPVFARRGRAMSLFTELLPDPLARAVRTSGLSKRLIHTAKQSIIVKEVVLRREP